MAVDDRDQKADPSGNMTETPAAARPRTVSDILRERREECGLEVKHIATILRIRQPVLEAIESGDFGAMPGPAYAVGFVRSYANYLGLDAEALVVRFKKEATHVAVRPDLNFPLPVAETRVPTGPIIIACALLAIVTYAGWYYYSVGQRQFDDTVPQVPQRLANVASPQQMQQEMTAAARPTTPAPAVSEPAQTTPAAPAAVPQPTAVLPPAMPVAPPVPAAADAPSASGDETDAVPPVDNRPGAAAVATAPSAPDLAQPDVNETARPVQQTTFGAPAADTRVVLKATEDSWLQVRDDQGNLLITRVLKPGETYNVPNQPGISMTTGNAGGIDIAVDGITLPKIGETGKVVRNVSLDPNRLLTGRPRAN